MTFTTLAYVMTLAGSVLGLRFVLHGRSILEEWGLEVTAPALIICRRLGALYLGLALVFFLGRGAGPSELRSALCIGLGAATVLLAGLGVFELIRGRARVRILVSAVVEVVLAGCFAWVGLSAG